MPNSGRDRGSRDCTRPSPLNHSTEAIGLDGRDSLKKEYRAQGPSYLTLTLLELASALDALLSFLPCAYLE